MNDEQNYLKEFEQYHNLSEKEKKGFLKIRNFFLGRRVDIETSLNSKDKAEIDFVKVSFCNGDLIAYCTFTGSLLREDIDLKEALNSANKLLTNNLKKLVHQQLFNKEDSNMEYGFIGGKDYVISTVIKKGAVLHIINPAHFDKLKNINAI